MSQWWHGPALLIGAGVIGWVLKRVLWDPIAQLRSDFEAHKVAIHQANYVTEEEMGQQVDRLSSQLSDAARARQAGEERILQAVSSSRQENERVTNVLRDDIRMLVQRVDGVMRDRRGGH